MKLWLNTGTDKKILDENTIKLGQFISKALDRYKDSVRKETISKCIKMNDRHGAIPNDFRHWYQDMRETNNNTTREK